MTLIPPFLSALRTALRTLRTSRSRKRLSTSAAVAAFSLTVIFSLAPPAPPSAADMLAAYTTAHAQTFTVSGRAKAAGVRRDRYTATPGLATLAASGTNYDWAKLVLHDGGWPMTEASVTVMVRWMRQENGPQSWWNRDNPLNNGLGSGGGGGTGSYPNLMIAAQMVAKNLQRNPGFGAIRAAFAAGAATTVIEQAIWASPWASSHYANGAHWHYTPVPAVKAPASAW